MQTCDMIFISNEMPRVLMIAWFGDSAITTFELVQN